MTDVMPVTADSFLRAETDPHLWWRGSAERWDRQIVASPRADKAVRERPGEAVTSYRW